VIMKTNLIMTMGLVAMLGICGTAVNAEDATTGQEVKRERKGKRGAPTEEQKARRAKHQKMMQEKYPEEMKEIEALRETDKKAARTKMKALIQKAKADRKAAHGEKAEPTEEQKARRAKHQKMMQEKYPEEMKEIEALRETDKKAARTKMKALIKKAKADRKAARGKKGGKKGGRLLEKYPEEMKEIQELRKTDKEAAKAKFKALIEKAKAERKAEKATE
jgi:hypothetical protein